MGSRQVLHREGWNNFTVRRFQIMPPNVFYELGLMRIKFHPYLDILATNSRAIGELREVSRIGDILNGVLVMAHCQPRGQ